MLSFRSTSDGSKRVRALGLDLVFQLCRDQKLGNKERVQLGQTKETQHVVLCPPLAEATQHGYLFPLTRAGQGGVLPRLHTSLKAARVFPESSICREPPGPPTAAVMLLGSRHQMHVGMSKCYEFRAVLPLADSEPIDSAGRFLASVGPARFGTLLEANCSGLPGNYRLSWRPRQLSSFLPHTVAVAQHKRTKTASNSEVRAVVAKTKGAAAGCGYT